MQNSSGEFSSFGTVNSESTSQVIVALCSLGINPDTDKRFIKNGKSLVDILLSYYVGNGFSHTKGSNYNQMATEQCFYGLVAYYRLCNNKNFLYNMTDVYEKPYDPTVTEATTTKPVESKPTVTNSTTHKNTTTNPTNTTNKTEIVYTTGSYNSTTENKTTPTYNNTNNYQPNDNSVNSVVNNNTDNSSVSEETVAETTSNTESTTVSNTTTSTTESTTVTNNSTKENKKSNVITKSKDYKDVFINLIMIFVIGILAVVLGTLIMMIKKKRDK